MGRAFGIALLFCSIAAMAKISSVVFNPNGNLLTSGSADATIVLWKRD